MGERLVYPPRDEACRRVVRPGIAVLLSVILLSFSGAVQLTHPSSDVGRVSPQDAVSKDAATVTLSSTNYSPIRYVPASLYGLNVNSYYSFRSSDVSAIAGTPVTYLRYPGGEIAETYNYTANVREDTHTPQPNGIANFINQCEAISCHAILQLPAEIDSPSTAASFVTYVESSLSFFPAYWEVGNEPATWTHFGCSWANWSSCHGTNATPAQFAALLVSYISAIRSVDPSTPIMAPGGTGQGSTHNYPWIYDELVAAGNRLGGVSIHSYANGLTSCSTDACFYSGLYGENSTTHIVAQAQQVVRQACGTCGLTQVFITEAGENTKGVNAAYETSFDGAVWVASELEMAIKSGAANLDWFAYDNGYGGSWELSNGGGWEPVYYLYADILPQIGNVAMNTTVVGDNGTLFALETYSTTGQDYALWVTNPSESAINVSLVGSGFPAGGGGMSYSWIAGATEPVATSWATLSSYVIPANSITVLTTPHPSKSGGGSQWSFTWTIGTSSLVGAVIGLAAIAVVIVLTRRGRGPGPPRRQRRKNPTPPAPWEPPSEPVRNEEPTIPRGYG